MEKKLNEVVVVDGVRTAFGKAGEKGIFWKTRADDLAVALLKALIQRNPQLRPDLVEDSIWGATNQVKEQGGTLGRAVPMLAGLKAVFKENGRGIGLRASPGRLRPKAGLFPHEPVQGESGCKVRSDDHVRRPRTGLFHHLGKYATVKSGSAPCRKLRRS